MSAPRVRAGKHHDHSSASFFCCERPRPSDIPMSMRRRRLAVGPLVLLWYGSSVIAIVTAKGVLREAAAPATMCAVQFACAVLGVRVMLPSSATTTKLTGRPEQSHVRGIGFTYALGFLLTNAAISVAAPSFVETFKSSEPLSTVGLAALILGDRERLTTLLALLPIVIGVAMASHGSAAFSLVGMAMALCSNLAFSGRAVLTKSLKRHHASSLPAGSDAVLFYHVSRIGFWLLLPCACLLDVRYVLARLSDPSATLSSCAYLVALLLINGCAHALYNGVSFLVLAKVPIATHAVLNIVRRVLLIAVSATVFVTPITTFNWIGVGMTAAGVALFARSKHVHDDAGKNKKATERTLLPV